MLSGDYAAVVGLTYVKDNVAERVPRCTGVLISGNMVLSAGHCICQAMAAGYTINAIFAGLDPEALSPGERGSYFPVKTWRTRYQCDQPGSQPGADLMVLKIDRVVQGITPVAMSPLPVMAAAKSARIAGFGATDAEGTARDYRKRVAQVAIVSPTCRAVADQQRYGCAKASELVAGKRNSPDTCDGDSGGPLLVSARGEANTANGNDLYLMGVTSRSVLSSGANCGVGGIYELLDQDARLWITAAEKAL